MSWLAWLMTDSVKLKYQSKDHQLIAISDRSRLEQYQGWVKHCNWCCSRVISRPIWKEVLAPLLITQIQARCDWRLSIDEGTGEMSEVCTETRKTTELTNTNPKCCDTPPNSVVLQSFSSMEMRAPPDQCKLNENKKNRNYLKQLLRVKNCNNTNK